MRIAMMMVLVGAAACGGMYSDKPEKLRAPKPLPHGAETGVAEPTAPPYDETCTVDFQRDPAKAKRDRAASAQLLAQGDTTIATAERTPALDQKLALHLEGLKAYRDSLAKDPYDADATLKLALEYDKLLRKGCALALLRRLDALTTNPLYASAAQRNVDRVQDNPAWFGAYRKDAVDAVTGAKRHTP